MSLKPTKCLSFNLAIPCFYPPLPTCREGRVKLRFLKRNIDFNLLHPPPPKLRNRLKVPTPPPPPAPPNYYDPPDNLLTIVTPPAIPNLGLETLVFISDNYLLFITIACLTNSNLRI